MIENRYQPDPKSPIGEAESIDQTFKSIITNFRAFHLEDRVQLLDLTADPTENLVVGQLASVSRVLKYYDGTNWKTVSLV